MYHWAANSPDTFKVLKAEKLGELMETDAVPKKNIAVLEHPKIKMWFLLAWDHKEVHWVTDENWGKGDDWMVWLSPGRASAFFLLFLI